MLNQAPVFVADVWNRYTTWPEPGPQQVNNETSTRAWENRNPPNELLENTEHEPDKWLDRGAPEEAIRADQDLETVEEVIGSKEPGR